MKLEHSVRRDFGMQPASAFLGFLAVLKLADSTPHDVFRYEITNTFRRNDDECRMCYGDDCLDLDTVQCEYFVEIDEIIAKPETPGVGTAVDGMISDLTQQAVLSWWSQECIPLISQYTSCNKDNLCIGCVVCHCSSSARWSCRTEQQCRAEPKLDLNPHTLAVVKERLSELENKTSERKKRYVDNVPEKAEAKPISLLDIAEWMYGATPTTTDETLDTATDAADEISNGTEPSKVRTTLSSPMNLEYLGFEEVLQNIANDQIYKRRKFDLNNNRNSFNYMDNGDTELSDNTENENFLRVLNALEEGNVVTESIRDSIKPTSSGNDVKTTSDGKFIVDLYPRENINLFDNNTDYGQSLLTKEDKNTLYLSNETIDLNSINIMKRDVSLVPNVDVLVQNTTTTAPSTTFGMTTILNVTEKENELKKHVLIPLTNIINDKQDEVKEFIQIRLNLLRIMKFYNESNETMVNITKLSDTTNANGTQFSIYKLDLYPEIHEDLRRINPNVVDKLLYKLKRDIYEVFKDIGRIQKLSRFGTLPDDLKLLIRAMKFYVNKQGSIGEFKKNEIQLQNTTETRRWMRRIANEPKSIVKQLVDIFDVIDKNSEQSNLFLNISRSSKKIINRVITQNYVDNFTLIGFKVFDPLYNLTEDLKEIGKLWPQMTAKLANSSPHNKLYALKLLHFSLSEELNKLRDAIAYVDFATSRRMSPLRTLNIEEVIARINAGLAAIDSKVQVIIKSQAEQLKNRTKNNKKKIKESFFKRIRNMLRGSKRDVIELAKKKIPKAEIFKTIAQKKLNELAAKKIVDDERTMLKWQNILNVAPRTKRDLTMHIKTMRSRIKNIIPNYLRGKISPAIVKHKTKKHSVTRKNKTHIKKLLTTMNGSIPVTQPSSTQKFTP